MHATSPTPKIAVLFFLEVMIPFSHNSYMQKILNCTQVIGVSNYKMIFTRIINSYIYIMSLNENVQGFFLKHLSYSIRGHIRQSYIWL